MTRAHKPENQNPNGLHDLGQITFRANHPKDGRRLTRCDRCGQPITGHAYKCDGERVCNACADRDPQFFGHCEE